MAGTVKGITIEFDANTTKLSKALSQVRSESRAVDSELKKIDRSLKFNPKNVDLWKQKQLVLREAIKKTEDNLKRLKDEQKKLDTSGVDRNSAEYRNLEREILKCENQLKRYQDQERKMPTPEIAANAEAIRGMGEKWQEVGGKIKSAGDNLTKYVTAPIVALAGASGVAWKQFDEGLDTIVKKTGATGEALEDMEGILKNVSTSIPTDFATAGQAIGEVNTRFGLTGQSLEDLSEQFIMFAKLNNTDVSTSIDQVQKALSAYGLGAEDAGAFLDRMNQVAQQTGVSVDKLEAGIIQNATAFQEMGLNVDQATVFMGQLEKSGANSETVMNGLRKALKNATKDGIPLNDALAELQKTIETGEEGVFGLQEAYDMFGKSGDQIFGAVKKGTLDFNALGLAVEDAGGSVADTFDEIQSPAEDFQKSLNELKIVGMELAETAMPYIQIALEKLSEIITTLREKWESLSPGQQDMIIKIGALVAVLGPLLSIIGSLIMTIGTIMTVGAPVLALISGAAIPIMAAVAAIAGLVSAGILLYRNWDTIKQKAEELLQNLSTKFTEIRNKVSSAVSGMVSNVTARWNALKATATRVFEGIKTAITRPIETARNTLQGIIERIKGFFPINVGDILKLRIPTISITGGKAPWGIGGKGSLPTFHVNWHAQGGIFTTPTIFATPNGFQGVGEAGAEAVIPLDELWYNMDRMADSIVNGVIQGQRMANATQPINITLYAFPGGAKMEEWVVNTYDAGKRKRGNRS